MFLCLDHDYLQKFMRTVFILGAVMGFFIISILNYCNYFSKIRIKDASLQETLYKDVRVLCWIMTSPKNHKTKAIHVRDTWAKRCNKVLFISSPNNDTFLETIQLNVSEGRSHLWEKTYGAFKYIHEHHLEEYDWFMKADDDTYVIMENLRYLLYQYSSDMPIYFGQLLGSEGYMAGGSGYILSKEGLKRFVEKGLKRNICDTKGGGEDMVFGLCMQKLEVIAGDARDDLRRERFFQFRIEKALMPKSTDGWVDAYIWHKINYGQHTCCSDTLVTTHRLNPQEMYLFEYLVYRLKVYGQRSDTSFTLPRKISLEEILEKVDNQKWIMDKF